MQPNWWEKYKPVEPETPPVTPRPDSTGGYRINPMVAEGKAMGELVPLEMRGKPPVDATIRLSDFTGKPAEAPKTDWLDKYQQVLTPEQEAVASEWANYLALARKHHGDRAIDIAGEGVTVAQDDVGLWRQAQAAARRSGWKAPDKASVMEGITTGLNDFSFGFSDEVGAGFNAALSYLWNLPGQGHEGAAKSAGDTYDLKMDQYNFTLDKAREDQGGVALATTLGASLIPGVGWASKAANTARGAQATTNLGKLWNGIKGTGKVLGGGAAMGELSGIGHARGDLGERIKQAGVESPLYGAAGGFLGTAAGRLLGGAVKKLDDAVRPVFMSPENRSLYLIERAMRRDGVDINDLMAAQRRVKAMGGDTLETLAEVAAYSGKSTGRNLRGLARALHAQPGRASEMAEALIQKRRAALHTGASKAVAAGTGQKVGNYADQIAELEDDLRLASTKAYDDFRASTVDPRIFEQRIVPILDSEPGRAAMQAARNGIAVNAAAARAAQDGGLAAQLDDAVGALDRSLNGNRIQLLPPIALDEVKKAFDDLIEAAGQRSYTGGILRTAKNNFADHVSSATGGAYGNALGTFSGGKRLRDAIDAGYSIFNKKAWQLDELLDGASDAGPRGILSAGEVEGVAFGFARALQDAIDGNDIAAVRRIMRDKAMQDKLRNIMGPSYPKFMSRVLRLMNRQDFDNFVAGGSPTARIQAELADAGQEDAMTRVLNNLGNQSAGGGIPSVRGAIAAATIQPFAKGAANLWRKLAYRGIGNEKINEQLGARMFAPMTDSRMRDLAGSMAARPASAAERLPELFGNAAGVTAAVTQGGDAIGVNSPEQRAATLVETADVALIEEYLDPNTPPARLREIEAHFGPQAAELWRLRAQASRQ